MSAVAALAADLVAIRQALGVSDEMTVEAIVCAALFMRQENAELEPLRRQLDAERGKSALIMEAFWLAIADLPHADDCTLELCEHQVECPHVAVDCTCKECDCACSCWRSVADKALEVDEAVKLCEQLRDREDELEAANARAERADGLFQAADLELNALKAKHAQALIELEDQRAESERFKRLTEIMHEMYDSGSATVIDVLEEVKRRVALEATE